MKKTTGFPPKPKVLDLFCGAGGLSLGFQQSGYEIVGGVDFFKEAVLTFEKNHLGAKGIVVDLTATSPKNLEKIIDTDIDVIVGGPSCQGFSTAGGLSKENGRAESDPRNSLFKHYIKVVKHFRPSWIVFENVPGLLLYRQGTVALHIVEEFRKIGYKIVPMILLAADYGVPQLRRRLVFIGNRVGSSIFFPVPSHGNSELWKNYSLPFAHLSRMGSAAAGKLPHVSFEEACSDLPILSEGEVLDGVEYSSKPQSPFQTAMRRNSRKVFQHACDTLAELDKYAAVHLKPGENWRSLPSNVLPPRFAKIRPYDATTLLKRLTWDRPAYTITTKFNEATTGAFIHPNQPRTISVREAARLQSFPDSFIFQGSFSQICKQIGNAVPPMLANAIGKAILPAICMSSYGFTMESRVPTLEIDNSISESEILQLKSPRKTAVPTGTRNVLELSGAI